MNHRARFLSVIVAGIGFLIAGGAAQAQVQLNPNHYWSYHLAAPVPVPDLVTVGDQFIPQIDLTGLVLDRMMTPAWKITAEGTVYAPTDTVTHYDWYDFSPFPFARTVLIDNQFGMGQQISVSDGAFLLAPAGKSAVPGIPAPPPPPGTNHYLCYHAGGPLLGIPVTLRDQFHEMPVTVLELTYFCVPCWKQHGSAYFPVADPVTHLALYHVDPSEWPQTPVTLTDQFVQDQENAVFQVPDEYLAVPSIKHEATATETRSWGRIKATYK